MEFDYAPFGIIGLETALPIALQLVDEGVLTVNEMVLKMSVKPAKLLNIDKGNLSIGAVADIAVIAPYETWVVDPAQLKSKGKNTPFEGWKMKGRVTHTIVGGKVVYKG